MLFEGEIFAVHVYRASEGATGGSAAAAKNHLDAAFSTTAPRPIPTTSQQPPPPCPLVVRLPPTLARLKKLRASLCSFGPLQLAWGLTDVGSWAYHTLTFSTFLPLYFAAAWTKLQSVGAGKEYGHTTSDWGLVYGLGSALGAVLTPVVGYVADRCALRRTLLVASTLLLLSLNVALPFLVLENEARSEAANATMPGMAGTGGTTPLMAEHDLMLQGLKTSVFELCAFVVVGMALFTVASTLNNAFIVVVAGSGSGSGSGSGGVGGGGGGRLDDVGNAASSRELNMASLLNGAMGQMGAALVLAPYAVYMTTTAQGKQKSTHTDAADARHFSGLLISSSIVAGAVWLLTTLPFWYYLAQLTPAQAQSGGGGTHAHADGVGRNGAGHDGAASFLGGGKSKVQGASINGGDDGGRRRRGGAGTSDDGGSSSSSSSCWQSIKTTCRCLQDRNLVLVLLSNMVSSDAVGTMYHNVMVFAKASLGLSNAQVVMATFVNRAASILFVPFLVCSMRGRMRTKDLYLGLLVASAACPLISCFVTGPASFFFLEIVLGVVGIGTYVVGRTVLALVVPPQEAAQIFALNVSLGRVSGFVGPLLFSLFSRLAGDPRGGYAGLVVLTLVSIVLFALADVRDTGAEHTAFEALPDFDEDEAEERHFSPRKAVPGNNNSSSLGGGVVGGKTGIGGEEQQQHHEGVNRRRHKHRDDRPQIV